MRSSEYPLQLCLRLAFCPSWKYRLLPGKVSSKTETWCSNEVMSCSISTSLPWDLLVHWFFCATLAWLLEGRGALGLCHQSIAHGEASGRSAVSSVMNCHSCSLRRMDDSRNVLSSGNAGWGGVSLPKDTVLTWPGGLLVVRTLGWISDLPLLNSGWATFPVLRL